MRRFPRIELSEGRREALWEIVDNRPTDAAAWLRSAPKDADPHAAVGHVFRQWKTFKASAA